MKKYIFLVLLVFSFSACSTKVEQSVQKSNDEDLTELLKTLIKKEREINDLKNNLQDCKDGKKIL